MRKAIKFTSTFVAALLGAFLSTNFATAQDTNSAPVLELGIRYMPTFTSFDVQTYNGQVIEGDIKIRHGFGGMLAINFGPHIGIQGEVNYYQVSQDYRDNSLDRTVKLRYINIPVLLSINTNKAGIVNLNFVAGPQFGINVGSKLQTSGTDNTGTLQATVAMKKGDVGFAYGAGLGIGNQNVRFDLGYRGFFGFVKISDDAGEGFYNVVVNASRQSHGAYVGITFLF